MNTAAGESYQDRVRYYRRKAEQARAKKNHDKWSHRESAWSQNGESVDIDFDEALYRFKQSSGFEKMYKKAKRHAFDNLSFYRDDEQGYIGGVCAGIADKMNWDVSTVRIVTVISGLALTLPTVIAYIAGTVFLRKKNLSFYGRDERNFWSSATRRTDNLNADANDARFSNEENS